MYRTLVYLLRDGKRFVYIELTEQNDLYFAVADHRQRTRRVVDFDYVLVRYNNCEELK